MKIDFHTHGKLSKNIPFSPDYIIKLFKQAKESGLDALCLTEHFNTLGYADMLYFLKENYKRDGDSLMVEGLRVFVGMEIDIEEKGHILVIGIPEDMLELNHRLLPYKEKGGFLSFIELEKILRNYSILWGAAHPFREGSNLGHLSKELLKKLDFIDLNGKDYGTYGKEAENQVLEFGRRLGLPILAGSDTHQSFQYGCIWNRFEKDINTVSELKKAVQEGLHKIEVLDYIKFKVDTASTLKRALKALHAAGLDYVGVL